MKANYRKNAMNMFADAHTAPAAQSVTMTMTQSSCAVLLDTAGRAVSFLFDVLLGVGALPVRIRRDKTANP